MQHLLNFTDFISPAILILAGIEGLLVLWLIVSLRLQQQRLLDSLYNLARSTKNQPEFNRMRRPYDDIGAYIDFLIAECNTNSADRIQLIENAKSQKSRYVERRLFRLETVASLISAGIQIFPLTGILGTILALARTSIAPDGFTASVVAKAFVIALDTTILGILFAIIFTFAEAAISPGLQRLMNESRRYRTLLTQLNS